MQNDEANPSLYGIVNQMTTGHEYLLQNFGVQPRIAWQLDPFGHSSVSPTLFALMGFDALVINRIHFHEKVCCIVCVCAPHGARILRFLRF